MWYCQSNYYKISALKHWTNLNGRNTGTYAYKKKLMLDQATLQQQKPFSLSVYPYLCPKILHLGLNTFLSWFIVVMLKECRLEIFIQSMLMLTHHWPNLMHPAPTNRRLYDCLPMLTLCCHLIWEIGWTFWNRQHFLLTFISM